MALNATWPAARRERGAGRLLIAWPRGPEHARNRRTVASALVQLTFGVRGVPLLLDAGHPAVLHDDP
jgi:hypothetical protein